MTDKLKKFVQEHRDQMDVHEPSPEMWNALSKQLIKKSFLNGLLQNSVGKLLLVGAAIVTAVAVYTFVSNKDDQKNNQEAITSATDPESNLSEGTQSTVIGDNNNSADGAGITNETINSTQFSGAKPESTVTDIKRHTVIVYYNLDRMSGGGVSNNFYNGAGTKVDPRALSSGNNGPSKYFVSTAVKNLTCSGNKSGQIDITPIGNKESYSFLWLPVNKTTEDISGLNAGTYTLSITDSHGSVGTFTYTVTEPTPISLSVSSEQAHCGLNNGLAVVTVNTGGPGPYVYSWNNGGTDASINNLASGSYNVTVVDNLGCKGVTSVNIGSAAGVRSVFTASLPGENAPLKVNFSNTSFGATMWTWKFGDGETDSNRNTSHTYAREGTYNACLIVQNAAGCKDSSCSNIMVNPAHSVMVPNVFTPNGDGKNDNFVIATKEVEKIEVYVYDQLGAKVWEYAGPVAVWDGTTNTGQPAIDGNYIYVYKAYGTDAKIVESKGIVRLAR
ncbi:MAG: gliding motility-associated C-terminal domain-containing protein [Bacteroidetes bacterium]|nr:gliding motility-associated C-terminal domain-containing protein [Bacteroidota bacterium]